ncbi:major facilitator superfamily domain-containing protein [Durotheca rogersii]|uniref:major facilitator superfamily domain-containing protein n=1 Tax=Durotheca rogersii TaxID=419775 RepID=UPI002220B8C3|nr:major facilitator superfamily domain-containing protein [Durotheca rogersii]KAI5865334.1 major facilitator superfamily domain-containing protein [Durotheca rogersii]
MAAHSRDGDDTAIELTERGENKHGKPDSQQAGDSQSASSQEEKAEIEYAQGLSLAAICLGLMLVVFCIGLDRSILSTAIPKIVNEFNSLSDIGWYGSAYLLTSCCFQLTFGKLYAEFNTKWVFMVSLVIFEVGSVVCAAASSSVILIVGRALAGVGVGGLFSGALIILAEVVPQPKRPMYTGLIGSMSGIAMTVAPTMSGAMTDRLTWRWCFWINLPIGGVTLATIFFFFRTRTRTEPAPPLTVLGLLKRIDALGTVMVVAATVCFLLALEWGGSAYPWSDWRVILCLCVFGVVGLAWLYYQYTMGEKAMVPFRILAQRSIAGSNFFSSTGFSSFYIFIYWIPIWFQAVKDVSAEQSGVWFLAATASYFVFIIVGGGLITKIGYYVPFMFLSSIMTSIGMGLAFTFNQGISTGIWVGALILVGAGTGIGGQTPIVTAQTVLKGKDIAIGTSVVIFVQTLAGAMFLSICNNIFTQRLIAELAGRVPEVDPAVVIASGASGVRAAMARAYPEFVEGIMSAYNAALQRVFLVGLILCCLSVLGGAAMEWVDVRVVKKDEAQAEGVVKK